MKKKKMFDGFGPVFSFTAEQTTKGKGFKSATIGVFVLMFAIAFGINMLIMLASMDKGDDAEGPNDVVISESEIKFLNFYGSLTLDVSDREGEKIVVDTRLVDIHGIALEIFGENVATSDRTEMLEAVINAKLKEDEIESVRNQVYESIRGKEDTVAIWMFMDEYDNICIEFLENPSDKYLGSNELGDALCVAIKDAIIAKTGIAGETVMAVCTGFGVSSVSAGEETNLAIILTKAFLPMLVSLVVYMLVLVNGQSITKAIVAEKASKLLETLLTSAKPYAVIAGKVIAMAVVALAQMAFWVAGAVGGFIVGNIVAEQIHPEFENPVFGLVDIIREGAASAFSAESVVIAVLAVIIGFFMYCCLAAFSASLADKPEDLSSVSGIFQIPVVIGFMIPYFASAFENETMMIISRYVPFMTPFALPSDALLGRASTVEGILLLLMMVACTGVLTIVTGKIYKNRVFGRN